MKVREFAFPWAALAALSLGLAGGARLAVSAPGAQEQPDAPSRIPAIILKVEGDGIANVRKKSGVLESAGARGQLFDGDRVITDARSAVHLMLNDGSVVKVGFNSEFRLESAELKDDYVSWVFRLLQGSVRALVERLPGKQEHLRIETAAGTVGVRGTEFILAFDKGSASSYLYMISGQVWFGPGNCQESGACAELKAGESSSFRAGQPAPERPRRIDVKELFGIVNAKGDPVPAPEPGRSPGPDPDSRMSLFRDARKVSGRYMQNLDEGGLQQLVVASSLELADAQDKAIGRTRVQREAYAAAIESGKVKEILAAADAYADSRGTFTPESNEGAENLVAQVLMEKFRLGQAVVEAEQAGLFVSEAAAAEGAGEAREFRFRKNVGYEKRAEARQLRERVEQASLGYRDTLEYAEAIQPDSNDAREAGAADEERPPRNRREERARRKNCDPACREARREKRFNQLVHELLTVSEGSALAYQGRGGTGVISGKSNKGLPVAIATRFFSRPTPGNGCFRMQEICTMKACANLSKGKKCKPGESVKVCEKRAIPVRCRSGYARGTGEGRRQGTGAQAASATATATATATHGGGQGQQKK